MHEPIQLTNTIPSVRNSISRAPLRRGFVFILLALASFAFFPAPEAFGVTPAPDGGYANDNTAEGTNALKSLSSFGTDNTATGFEALFANTDGSFNTANGFQALQSNTTSSFNTATGSQALYSNTTGGDNTATGSSALSSNTTGNDNTATGILALSSNTTGSSNTAIGDFALSGNTTGNGNTATGSFALSTNTTGSANAAYGDEALFANTTGVGNTATGAFALFNNDSGNNNTATGANALSCAGGDCRSSGNNNTATGACALAVNAIGNNNTAEGFQALANSTTGSNNIALGSNAGINLTTGSNNIDIGARGVAGESNTIRIGTVGVQKSAYVRGISGATVASGVTVIVAANGHLGTVQSSARFKDEIKPMDKASEAILALKPVTFRYKKELDPEGIPQFGLVAEQVEKVNPDLVARDENGEVYSVRYEAVNAMLLNEFLKEHRKVQELEATAAQQQMEIKALAASLNEQAAQIQKVSAQLEVNKFPPQMIASSQ